MPTKKKPRPLFEVPVEIGSRLESGWVYRSSVTPDEPEPPRAKITHTADAPRPGVVSGVSEASARTLSLAMATVAQTFMLIMTIAVIPVTLGNQAIQALAGNDEPR